MPIHDLLNYFSEAAEGAARPIQHLLFNDDGAHGSYAGMDLYSAFQPLFSADKLLPVAHEALLRARNAEGRAISPLDAFAVPKSNEQIIYFDRLCRVVHAVNFAHQSSRVPDLYLNISGRHLISVNGGHGQFFEAMLRHCGLQPAQIVLEILESRVDDLKHLQAAIAAYRLRGYRIAIDDFGCQNSNFDRLWQLTPDIVKLDRSLIVEATSNPRARRILPKLVDIVHDLGAIVVCEGVETVPQHQIAVDAGVDLLQGFYYARPAPDLVDNLPNGVKQALAARRPASALSGQSAACLA